jgi:subtilisin-like proprotein convertase family protein/subtilisin family serine protease
MATTPGRVRVLLEFLETPDVQAREWLEAAGVRLLGPLSGTTFFASIPERLNGQELVGAGIRWLGAIYEEDKVPRRILESGIGEWAWRVDGSVDLRVRSFDDAPVETALEALGPLEALLLARSDDYRELTVNLPAERLGRLLSEPWVRWVEEVLPPRVTLNDSSRANTQADGAQAVPYGLTGAGVALGLWDSGDVETAHADFAGRLVLAQSRGSADLHATHVAGTMAGSGARSEALGGVRGQWRGMAPGATVISYDYETAVEEHQEAIHRYGIVNSQNSWGFLIARFLMNCDLYGKYSHLAPDYDAIVTGRYGRPITVVFAAGNNRTGFTTNDCSAGPYRTIGPPGTAKNVLTVGAIDSVDHAVALFSSWGPVSDGRLKPELVAPGAQRTVDMGVTSTVPGNRYGVLQGTSMAAPAVSGAIGLLVEDYREHYNGSDPFPCTVRALLIHTALDLRDAGGHLHPGPDYASGYGRLQVQAAVDQLREEAFLVGVVEHGATNRHYLEVPAGAASVKVTLVWDDPPGLENAAQALVNDLDLVVIDPDGQRHYPWTLDPENPSAPATQTREDRINVIEQVAVEASAVPGTWLVDVVGHVIPTGLGQRYTLAFTPAGIPQPPLVLVEEVQIQDVSGDSGNADGFTDPGETRSMRVTLRHEAGPALTGVMTRLFSETPGVDVLQPESPYPDLGAGDVAANAVDYVYRVDKTVPCATLVQFAQVWEAGTHRSTNRFTEWIGRVTVTNHAVVHFESSDVPQAIPDRGSISSSVDVTGIGRLTDVQVSLRIDHPWHGDLRMELTHPDGTRVRLVDASGNSGANFGSGTCGEADQRTRFDDRAAAPIQAGGAPFVGSFRPVGSLGVLAGKPLDGIWRLQVADVAAEDVGTLLCWGVTLGFEEDGFVCDLFNRPPVVVSDHVEVVHDTPRWIRLPAMDPDGDPIRFALTDFPRHGALSEFDEVAGRVRYAPMPGFVGVDSFQFVAEDPYHSSPSATVTLHVLPPLADLRLEVESSPGSAALSLPFASTLRVLNLGPNPARQVQITHELPEGFQLLEVVPTQGSWTNSSSELWLELGELEVWGTAEVRIVGQVLQEGDYSHRAGVLSADSDPHPESNEVEWVVQVLRDADLEVRLEAATANVLVGQEVRYEVRVRNQGPHEARAVELEVEWIGGVELVDVELSEGDWGREGDGLRFDLGTMGLEEERVVGLVVRALADGPLTGEVWVRSMELDPWEEDNQAQAMVMVVRWVDLGIEQVAPNEVLLGSETRQVWVVRNGGPSVGSGVLVVGEVERGLELEGLEGSQGVWTNTGNVLRWEVGELGPGQEAELVLMVRAVETGWWTNRATVSGLEIEGWMEDNVMEKGTEVIPSADLGVGVLDGLGELLVIEKEWRYELSVTNRGPSVAHGVELALELGEGLEWVEIELENGQTRSEAGGVVCELGDLAVGRVVTVGLRVQGMEEGSWMNVARLSGVEADPEEADNQVEWVSEVRRESDLKVELERLGSGDVLVGQEVRYEVRVRNQGPHEARAVELEVEWIGGVELVDVELSEGDWGREGDGLRFDLGTMGLEEERVVGLVVRALADGPLTGEVWVRSMELDPWEEDNQAQAMVMVVRWVDLGIEQVAPNEVLLGSETRQVWVVRNGGPSVGSGVLVVGEVERGLELEGLEGSQGVWTNTGNVLRWEVGELGPGQEAELVLMVRAVETGWWTNRATVSGLEIEGWMEDNVMEKGTEVIPSADLGVGVLDGLGELLVIEKEWRYELSVTNRGPSVAHGVELALELGEGLEWVEIELENGQTRSEAGGVVCELGDLAVGRVVTVGLRVQGMEEGSWMNVARLSGVEADPEEADNQVEWVSEVRRESDLKVELERLGSGDVLVGQEVRYEVRVRNQGPHEARAVELEVEWIGGVELVDVELSEGDWGREGDGLRFDLGTMGLEEERVVGLVVRALADGPLTGEVWVRSMELDPWEEDNQAQAMVMVVRWVDLGIEQVAPSEVLLGSETRQVWVVRNGGPSVGSGVLVVGEVERGLELEGLEGSQGVWTNTGNVLRWEVGELGPGQEAELVLMVRAVETGWWTNRATVSGLEIEGWMEDNVMEKGTEVIPSADLGLRLDEGTGHVLPLGQELRYGLWVRNRGPSSARNIAVGGSVGGGLELLAIESTRGTGQLDPDGLWTWELEELAAGDEVEIGLTARGDAAGVWEWSAQATLEEVDPEPADNRLGWLTEVREESDLDILELRVDQREALVGEPLVYEVRLTNRGPHPAERVMVDWEWLGKIELIEVDPSQGEWTQQPSRLQCDLGTLAVDAEAYIRVRIAPARAGELLCQVSVRSAVLDPDANNNEATVMVSVLSPADLLVTQTAFPDPVMDGDHLNYFISVHNRGEYTVPDLQLLAWLPSTVDFVTAITSQGLMKTVAGVLEWDLGPVAPGTNATVTLTVVPRQVGTITNTVMAVSRYAAPDNPNLVSELVIQVVDRPPLRVDREGSRIVLSWPLLAEEFILFATDSLVEPVMWYPDGNPREVVGNRVTVTVKVTTAARYYRLSRP